MPTPVSAARACLAADAADALDAAASTARRRSHAQTTSLHVIFSLLSPSSPSPPLLRNALSRARSSSYSPRLQLKALDFCFSVSLDRLPSSSSAVAVADDDPPVSNSLMAAIKRSQANQRRHPDTFHLYQQQQQQASGNGSPAAFAGVKVELQQLVLAVLDDPIVSRVFGEAGFRSCDIKLAVLRPPPPILRFPRAARCPPLFLCNFSAAEGLGFSFPAHLAADGGDENCRRIAEVLSRKPGAARNLMLVGVGAAEAARDISRAVEQRNWSGLPPDINGVRVVSIEGEIGDKVAFCERLEELGRDTEEHGVVVSIGDLNGLVEGNEDAANCLVAEVTKVLELRRGRLWVMGWSDTYETYLKFLSRHPLVDKDWDLQLLPITSHRTGIGGLLPKPPSLMDSFVPFGGLFPQSYETMGTSSNPFQSLPRCQRCNEKYEQEVAAILKGGSASLEDQQKTDLPSWLQKADVVGMKGGFDSPKVKDDKNSLNAKIIGLQNKWNEYCQHAHRGYQIVDSTNYQVLPHLVGIPYVSDTISFTRSITNPSIPQSQSSLGNAFAVSISVPKATAVSTSISLPIAAEPKQQDLISKLHDKVSKCEPLFAWGFQSHQVPPSDLSIQDGHSSSPSSLTSVTTELVLGAVAKHSALERKSVPEGSSQCSTPRKVDELSQCVSRVHSHASSSPTFPDSPSKGSYIHAQTLSCAKTGSGISSIEQRDLSPPTIHQEFDVRNYKAFYKSLIGKVGRQEEALWAISEAIIHCKTNHGPSRRGAIWLSFLGPDRAGKKMAALALAELIFGSRDNLICIDLAYADDSFYQGNVCDQHGLKNWNASYRGKTMFDHLALEMSKKPMSVFLLDNVDKADVLAQSSLSNAIRNGKFSDSFGREYSINSSIFVTTAKSLPEKAVSPRKENISFSEERILAAPQWQMKILAEPFSEAFSCSPISKVSVTSRQESKSRPAPLCSLYISKRKLNSSSKHKGQDEYSTKIKRPHRSSGMVLDLNLPAEEDGAIDCNSSGENNYIMENSQEWLEEFFDLMDKTVSFKTFDFDSLADYVMKEISTGFSSTIASNCRLEIDVKVMEQILAATWFMRNQSDLGEWIEEVLCSSLKELRQNHKLSGSTVVKLVANQDSLMEEGEPWVFLPSKIILE